MEVVGPRHVTAEVGGFTSPSVGQKPSIEFNRIATAVAFKQDIGRFAGDGRRSCVRHVERGRRRCEIAASICHRKGHFLELRVSASGNQPRAVVGPSQRTTRVRGVGTSVVGEPSEILRRVVRSVTFVCGVTRGDC